MDSDLATKRIIIFIDNSNIFNGFKKYKIKADYEKLKERVRKGRKLMDIILYEGVVYPIDPSKKKWYKDLKNNSNYSIKTSFDKVYSDEPAEKKIDVEIAIDIISKAYEDLYDRAILISGDGDFVPVIKKVKELNKEIEIWGFRYSLANVLKEEAGKENVFYLDDYIEAIQL